MNNRYVWTSEEVKPFLALIEEEKNITAILDGKGPKRGYYQKHTTSPGMCVVFRSNHLMETHLIRIYFLRTFQRFSSPFRWKHDY